MKHSFVSRAISTTHRTPVYGSSEPRQRASEALEICIRQRQQKALRSEAQEGFQPSSKQPIPADFQPDSRGCSCGVAGAAFPVVALPNSISVAVWRTAGDPEFIIR